MKANYEMGGGTQTAEKLEVGYEVVLFCCMRMFAHHECFNTQKYLNPDSRFRSVCKSSSQNFSQLTLRDAHCGESVSLTFRVSRTMPRRTLLTFGVIFTVVVLVKELEESGVADCIAHAEG